MLGSRHISVYCHMGDFGCGSGGWTPVMKTDGTKVKDGGEICCAIFIRFEKMVLFYFFVNFSNVLQLYFLTFRFSLRRIVISTKIMWFGDILRESSELYNFIKKPLIMSIVYRKPSTIRLVSGGTRTFTTLQEERLVLTIKKPNCPLIGRHASQRFVSEWGAA